MPSDDADRLLVSRIRREDGDAWQELIDRFEGRLLAFVDSRLNDPAASEDVVQDTFVGFLRSLPNYDERKPLESYLFSIAGHKLIDVLRSEGRRPAIPLSVSSDSSGRSSDPPGSARRASSLLRSREGRAAERRVIVDCLDALIREWKSRGQFERLKCIELLFVRGTPNKQAAECLGISEQAVANHKHFVITKLKEAAARSGVHDLDLAACGIGA